MLDWRFLRGWTDEELEQRLAIVSRLPANYEAAYEDMTARNGWTVDGSDDSLGFERPGPPEADGLFARAKQAIIHYDFSDPRIVEGYFRRGAPLDGRNMLLEMKVLGLRFLAGVRVCVTRDEASERLTDFGYRYDTLAGHLERGAEWFILTKSHADGEVRFRIEARWQPGDFPNWWTRLGFLCIGERYRAVWRRRAPERLRRIARQPEEQAGEARGTLTHRGEERPQRTESL